MRSKIKGLIFDHVGLKLLSITLAFVLWFVVMNVEDSIITKSIYDIPVEMLNGDVILKNGGVYDVTEGETVNILVKGPRSVVEGLEASNFKATADLSHLSVTNSTTIVVNTNDTISSNNSRSLTITPLNEYVTVTIEEESEKSIPVKVITTGNVKSGHALGNPAPTPNMITVKGPESVLSNIVEARAVVDVTNEDKDIEEVVRVGCIDGYGNAVQKDNVSLSAEKIKVTIPVYRTKTVPVIINTVGNPAEGFGVRNINYEPSTVIITGEGEDLSEIESISINNISVTDASETIESNVALADCLPPNIYIADDTSEIAVSVDIERVETKEVTLSTVAIKMINQNNNYKYQVSKPPILKIKVTGFQEDMLDLSIDSLNPRMSVQDMEPGEHEVQVMFDESERLTISDKYTVTVEISEK